MKTEQSTTAVQSTGEEAHGIVVYTDGGSRPNPGNGGWGVHGYLYKDVVPKKASGNSGHILTKQGYLPKLDKANLTGGNSEVTPLHYVDGYGSFSMPISNNVAELQATTRGLEHAIEYDVKEVQVYTDSEYVRKGLESWVDGWKRNGWLKQDMTEPANVSYWKRLIEVRDLLVNRGTTVKINWVKGHNDNLGNTMADVLATAGVMASKQRQAINSITTSLAEGYWKYSSEKHPFICHRRMYFNTMSEYNRPGEYYIGEHGKDDDLVGKRISDGAYAVVILKEPDPAIELVRAYQVLLGKESDTIILARLDQLFSADFHQQLNRFGTFAIERTSDYRLDLESLNKEPLTRELVPPKLAMRTVASVSDLAVRLHAYLDGDDLYTETDLTSILYDRIEKTSKKGDVTVEMVLKPEYGVGFAALNVDANYKAEGGVDKASVVLTLGIDLPDRNALKRLEEKQPNVRLISWLESPTVFRYATVITCDGDKGIWAGVYSNMRIITK